jgi:hypothetical protein
MTIQPKRLAELFGQLASRPGHETIRVLLNELCVVGLKRHSFGDGRQIRVLKEQGLGFN